LITLIFLKNKNKNNNDKIVSKKKKRELPFVDMLVVAPVFEPELLDMVVEQLQRVAIC